MPSTFCCPLTIFFRPAIRRLPEFSSTANSGAALGAAGRGSGDLGSRVPLGIGGGSTSVKPEGYNWQPHESMEVPEEMVGPDYLHTLQIALAAGRDLHRGGQRNSAAGGAGQPGFRRPLLAEPEPLGKRIMTDISDKRNFLVVGVTRNTSFARYQGRSGAVPVPSAVPALSRAMTVHVRVAGDPWLSPQP